MARILVLGAGLGGLSHGDAAGPRRARGDRARTRPGRATAAGARRRRLGRLAAARRQPVPAAALHAAALVGSRCARSCRRSATALVAAGAQRLNTHRGAAGGAARPDAPGRRAVRHRDRPPAGARGGAVGGRRAPPGVTIRRGVAVTGLTTDGRHAGAPGDRRAHRRTAPRSRADLVVDCGGRRSALGAWLTAVGRPAPGRGAGGLRLRLLRPALPLAHRRAPGGAGQPAAELRLARRSSRCRPTTAPGASC